MNCLETTNKQIAELIERMQHPEPVPPKKEIYLGVDVGTANVITVAVDATGSPLGGKIYAAKVVREGMIVDYLGAVRIVREQVENLRQELNHDFLYASSSYPPKTEGGNIRVTSNILEAAGLRVVEMSDEPTAAALALGLRDGAVIDVGGGTTGVSILKDGKVIATDDEPTGGFQFDLVIAGGMNISVEEAEAIKRDSRQQALLLPVVRPVMEKVCSIVRRLTDGYPVDDLFLVGGSCGFQGFADLIQKELGIRTHLPDQPLYVTPLGIALTAVKAIEGMKR